MKKLSALLAVGMILALTAVSVLVITEATVIKAGLGREIRSLNSEPRPYVEKIHGRIESLLEGTLGTWIVNGKEIQVTRNTCIKEELGRATAGAYVEVAGSYLGNSFVAHTIEVKSN